MTLLANKTFRCEGGTGLHSPMCSPFHVMVNRSDLSAQVPPCTASAANDRVSRKAGAARRVLAQEQAFEIRPIRPTDAGLILAAVAYTSPETYYRRFHASRRCFRPKELKYLTEVDGNMHVALVAIERGNHPRLAAVARFVRDPANPLEGELAIVVHDPFRRKGLGTEMLRRLHDEASSRGVRELRAMVQADNSPMRELLHHAFPETRVAGFAGEEVDYLVPVHPHAFIRAA